MALTTYTVTTDKAVFWIVLRKLFQERELSTLMSIICYYSEAVEEAPENALYTKIDYYKMCKEAQDDGIDNFEIETLLENLSTQH